LFQSADNANLRAIELDPKWGKAYSRLAEVFMKQCRYTDAHATYQKAIDLVDEKQKKVYQLQRDKIDKLLSESTAGVLNSSTGLDPKAQNSGWYITAMEKDISDPKTYKTMQPCPLGYLTAADKVYLA